jgi:hypothetical protein
MNTSSTITEVELAYAAGFFDGEGTVGLYWQKPGRFHPTCGMSNTDRSIVQWYADNFGGTVYEDKFPMPQGPPQDLDLAT